jgi:ribonucleotide monophosphatase NagD (HAD superfamily)
MGGSNSGLGKQVVFVTNNSTKSRADYRKKLEGLGIPSNVVSSDQTRIRV